MGHFSGRRQARRRAQLRLRAGARAADPQLKVERPFLPPHPTGYPCAHLPIFTPSILYATNPKKCYGQEIFHLRGFFLENLLGFYCSIWRPMNPAAVCATTLISHRPYPRHFPSLSSATAPDGLPFDQNRRDDLCSIGRGILICCDGDAFSLLSAHADGLSLLNHALQLRAPGFCPAIPARCSQAEIT